MPLKSASPSSRLNPSGVTSRGDGSQAIAAGAAQKYGVSAAMLWGVYGTESGFGSNTSNSSAGAQGPMQFEPATWAKYGGGGNVQDLAAAMPAAAHYLHDLGATTDITNPKTVAAINAYNGNGGGASTSTSYYQSVIKNAQGYTGSGSGKVNASNSGDGSATPSSSGSGGGSILSVITDLLSGDIESLAATLALATVTLVKDAAVGMWDLLVVPVWHRNQNAVWYYSTNVLLGQGGTYQLWITIPATSAFWGLGYALLFVDPESGSLKPASIRRSRLTRHARKVQAIPARRELTKPSEVKARTPKKPNAKISSVTVNQVGTMTATRKRPITVEGDNDRRGGGSETPIEQVSTASASEAHLARTVPHPHHPGRQRTPEGRRGTTQNRSANRRA